MSNEYRRKCVAEGIGTFCLVFVGTSAIVVNASGAIGHAGVAAVFGLVVFAMIASLGDVSGAHLNPAVTIGFFVARRLPGQMVGPYMMSQCIGALVASGVVRLLFPHATGGWGDTSPTGPIWQSWILEMLLTAGLMFVILSVSTGASEKGITAGIAIGAVIALEAMFAGPICGASMNPARSLGPAIVSLHLGALWVYMTAPVVGAVVAVPLCRCVRDGDCCRPATVGDVLATNCSDC